MTAWKLAAKWTAVVTFVVATAFFLAHQSRLTFANAERVRIAEEQEAVAVAFARQQTANFERERLKTLRAERALYAERQNSLRSLQSADSAVADAHQVLQDSAASAHQLRASLTLTVNNLDSLSGQFRAYIARTDSVLYRVAVERAAADSALVAEKRAHEATKRARDVLRRESQCKVWFVSCPTRTQTAIGTALITGLVITFARD
jgi:hypothetical protein